MPRDSWRIIARDLVPPRSVFVFSDEEGSRGAMLDRGIRMEQGTLERFEILFPCARKSLTGWRVCFHANASRLMKFNAAPLSRNFIFERKCLVGRVN